MDAIGSGVDLAKRSLLRPKTAATHQKIGNKIFPTTNLSISSVDLIVQASMCSCLWGAGYQSANLLEDPREGCLTNFPRCIIRSPTTPIRSYCHSKLFLTTQLPKIVFGLCGGLLTERVSNTWPDVHKGICKTYKQDCYICILDLSSC